MRLQPYREMDAEIIVDWMKDEREHAKWCANIIPYPMTIEIFHDTLLAKQVEWNHVQFVATTDEGELAGFFFFKLNYDTELAYMGFVTINPKFRGLGYGKQMMNLAFQYIFTIAKMKVAALKVYDNNEVAHHMYSVAGMRDISYKPNSFTYKDELWGTYYMEITREQFLAV